MQGTSCWPIAHMPSAFPTAFPTASSEKTSTLLFRIDVAHEQSTWLSTIEESSLRIGIFMTIFSTLVFLISFLSLSVSERSLKPRLHMAQFKRARPGTEPGSVPGPDTRLFTLSGPGITPTQSSIWPPSICVMSCVCWSNFLQFRRCHRASMASLQQLRK